LIFHVKRGQTIGCCRRPTAVHHDLQTTKGDGLSYFPLQKASPASSPPVDVLSVTMYAAGSEARFVRAVDEQALAIASRPVACRDSQFHPQHQAEPRTSFTKPCLRASSFSTTWNTRPLAEWRAEARPERRGTRAHAAHQSAAAEGAPCIPGLMAAAALSFATITPKVIRTPAAWPPPSRPQNHGMRTLIGKVVPGRPAALDLIGHQQRVVTVRSSRALATNSWVSG